MAMSVKMNIKYVLNIEASLYIAHGKVNEPFHRKWAKWCDKYKIQLVLGQGPILLPQISQTNI